MRFGRTVEDSRARDFIKIVDLLIFKYRHGPYSVTVPPGSFIKNKKGAYLFQGTINGTPLQVRINTIGSNSYTFQAEGSGAHLRGIANPVTVTLTATIQALRR